MNQNRLRDYARLIARKGIHVMPGQEVIVRTAPEELDFLEMVVEECYLAGAKKVSVEWRYDPLTKLDTIYQTTETLGTVEPWEEEKLRERVENLPANIYLDSDDPDGMSGADMEKWAEGRQHRYAVTKQYSDAMENRYQWCVAAVPGRRWAEKVFPNLSADEAVEKLWETILSCGRIPKEGGAEAAWDQHNQNFQEKCSWLNSLKLRRLKYNSRKTGTNFEVGLLPQMRFMGGADPLETPDGRKYNVMFNANIPTEEIFTTPRCGDAEGIVYATRPLSYRGILIEDFSIRFHEGKAVEVHAAKNEEALKQMIAMDEGACMLGECALVPFHSPIQECGILFYSTLLDENASCHLALGAGYSSCLENASEYTQEQAYAIGVNDSMIHEDFMIGSEDLNIIGITENGEEIEIFRNGDWA